MQNRLGETVDEAWYVLRVESTHDSRARYGLERRGFKALSLRIYVCRIDRRRKVHENIELMFPGYVLVRLPTDATPWAVVLRSPFVIDVLRHQSSGNPAPLPDKIADALLKEVDSTGLVNPHDVPKTPPMRAYQPGQVLKFTRGAYEGLIARFAERRSAERINLLMPWFGGERRISVPETHVEVVDE